jgi:hypothetical protein
MRWTALHPLAAIIGLSWRRAMDIVMTIGLDIAKSVFQVHSVDAAGEVVVRRKLTRGRVLGFFRESAPMPPRDSPGRNIMVDSAMAHLSGTDRSQLVLLPEAVDDYVRPDNPVRFIEAFIDQLDLTSAGFIRVTAKAIGRPGYDLAQNAYLGIYE